MSKAFDRSKAEVAKLCKFFETNRTGFRAAGVKEAHIRQSLIDPFFEALGWDVRNSSMTAPQYREVVPEDSLDVEGHQKAPDYTFRVGSVPKFYVEAKKCGVNIGTDPAPAYQLRRYGWSAKLAVSLLTDFEELAVYDCTLRPAPKDKATHARTHFFDFEEYVDNWQTIWGLFSREAVWSGAFDQYAASKRKRGSSEVDEEFLKDIEGWRDKLARNIALRNKQLSSDDLNAAVQLTIDRIVFLRMAEDRGLEAPDRLLTLCERSGIYPRFILDLCKKANQKYNSGLFHFQREQGVSDPPDKITPALTVDDKVLKPILESLYFVHGSPYHFGVLPVEILGTVYERFLGKVIRLTPSHQAKIEEKPEVRKAGGVYYTPAFIVEYVVTHSVKAQIQGRSPANLAGEQSAPVFRVLDMACGSGSFLLRAYQCLLDHCLEWYADHRPETHKKAVYKDAKTNGWRLTIEEKKRILTTHLFGVDIDAQAVEVSKLSLLLKALEGENDTTVSMQLKLFHERVLPNLSENIKCGNSLIVPGYFAGKPVPAPTEMKRVNPFDWTAEFPDAKNDDRFDCVIGNPPWVSLTGRFRNDICPDDELQYLIKTYSGNTYMPNMYEYFVTKGTELTKDGGRFGYIVPDRLGFNLQFVSLRKRILKAFEVESLVYRMPFPGVTADTLTFILRKGSWSKSHKVPVSEFGKKSIALPQQDLLDSTESEWLYFEDSEQMALANRLATGSNVVQLASICKTTSGYGGKSELVTEQKHNNRQIPTLKGTSIVRYFVRNNYWFEFTPKNITGRTTDKAKLGAKPKVLLRKTGNSIVAAYDDTGVFPEQSLYFLFAFVGDVSPLYVLGLLNSTMMDWYYRVKCLTNKASIAQVKKIHLDRLPIRLIDDRKPADKALGDKVVAHVSTMLTAHKQLSAATSEAQENAIRRQAESTEREINRIVYELYGLTTADIAVVEGQ